MPLYPPQASGKMSAQGFPNYNYVQNQYFNKGVQLNQPLQKITHTSNLSGVSPPVAEKGSNHFTLQEKPISVSNFNMPPSRENLMVSHSYQHSTFERPEMIQSKPVQRFASNHSGQ